MNQPLILASQSPRRLELLDQINLKPSHILPADIDETPFKNEKPRQLVERLAISKGQKIKQNYNDSFILSADTVVALGTQILGKPQDSIEAAQYLEKISGRRHDVIGGICLITPRGKEISRVVKTSVKVKRLTHKEIDSYVSSREWEGKAGSYGIQGSFTMYISDVLGSYTNIVGLCLYNTRQMLVGSGYKIL